MSKIKIGCCEVIAVILGGTMDEKFEEALKGQIDLSLHGPRIGDPDGIYQSLHKELGESEATNYEVCRKCGGKCCLQSTCYFSPEDFEDRSVDGLKEKIEEGYITIQIVDGDMLCLDSEYYYILRMRREDGRVVESVFGRSGRGCVMLGKDGCQLDYAHRPTGGKQLIPKFAGGNVLRCRQRYSIEQCCREWEPYKWRILELIDYFDG